MLKRLFMVMMLFFVAAPAMANEAPEILAATHSNFDNFVQRQAHKMEAKIAQEMPEFVVPSLGYMGGTARMDADSDYESARSMFKTGRLLGILGYPVMFIGIVVALLGAVGAAAGGGGGGFGAGLIITLGGGLMVVAGAALGQIGWMNAAKAAALKKPPGPAKAMGFISLGLLAASIGLSFVTGTGGGLLFLLSYIFAEVQNSATHAYWNGAGAKRKGLPKALKLKLAPNGIVGRF